MRDRGRSPQTRFLGTREVFRLVSMLFMLAVIGLTITNFRTRNQRNAPPRPGRIDALPAGDAVAKAGPAAARVPGPEDDPAELMAFEKDSQLISDRATAMHPIEMPAYWRLFSWIQQQPLAALRERAKVVSFSELVHHPAKYRGRLIRVELAVRRVLNYEAPGENAGGVKQVYELWGWPAASDGWLYVVVTPELPAGLSVGTNVEATVTLYGYFFKLQGYSPADAKPNARPLVAPLIVGRLDLHGRATAARQASPWGLYAAVTVSAIIFAGTLGVWFFRRRDQSLDVGAPYDSPEPSVASFDLQTARDSEKDATDDDSHESDFDWIDDQ